MAADDRAMQGAMASPTMIFTIMLNRIVPHTIRVNAPEQVQLTLK